MIYNIDDRTIENIADLAQLELSVEQKKQAREDMEKLLGYINRMNKLNTDEVEPESHIFPVTNVFRTDIVTNGNRSNEMMKNAPQIKDNMIVVPKTF